jgi:ABC-type dipeptide/oligopeptide/nickel transport system permease subunit
MLAHADPNRVDLLAQFQGPSGAHPFGTDNFGRDLWGACCTAGAPRLA